LASSRLSLNSPDVIDVAAVMDAFEQMNSVTVALTGRVVDVGGNRCLRFLVEAHDSQREIGEVPSLGFVSVVLGYGSHKTLESAIMWALYQLDWKLAEAELQKNKAAE